MALKITFKETEFGIGDRVRVTTQKFTFEGMVIAIRGREPSKTFTVRRIAEGRIGVERIFPLNLPTLEKVVVVKKGTYGVKRAKLYYTREKSTTEIENIFKRTARRTHS